MNTVLITGCGKGIGFHLANRMAQVGWNVISTVHSTGHVQGPLPGKVIEMDVSNAASVAAAAKEVPDLDVLINNAIFRDFEKDVDVLGTPPDLVLKSLDVNVVGALRVAQAFTPALSRSKSGRIVNVSSIWGQLSGKENSPAAPHAGYFISKCGLNMVTVLLSCSLRPNGIAVNSICPSGGGSMDGSVEEIVKLATEYPQSDTGKFFHCRQPTAW